MTPVFLALFVDVAISVTAHYGYAFGGRVWLDRIGKVDAR